MYEEVGEIVQVARRLFQSSKETHPFTSLAARIGARRVPFLEKFEAGEEQAVQFCE